MHAAPRIEDAQRETPAPVPVQRRRATLYTIAVILLILWLLGFVSGYTIAPTIKVKRQRSTGKGQVGEQAFLARRWQRTEHAR